MLHVTSFTPLTGYRLRLVFSDGAEGDVDLSSELSGPVFQPLRDPARFSEAYLDEELKTICWPNGADLAPEFLRDLVVNSRDAAA